MDAICRLKGIVKEYDWGGTRFIPELLLQDNSANRPFAEYWMGVHPQGMATVGLSNGSWVSLAELTPSMPFLLKVLDVKNMLSIQVHPNKADAQLEFEKENQLGISLSDPTRNYKDNNHKPELMVALSEFWLLHGFKPAAELRSTLEKIAELQFLLPIFEKEGYKGLYRCVMEMPQAEVDQVLIPLRDRILPLYQQEKLTRYSPDYWAAKAFITFGKDGHADRGIFSVYFFNLVKAEPGQAVFQNAGIPHAYLEGQNVEIMANSDNVLRGGLTNKHIDVSELMKHILFVPVEPSVISAPVNQKECWFDTPVQDFKLGSVQLNAGEEINIKTEVPTILLCTEGVALLESGGSSLTLQNGEPAAYCRAGEEIRIFTPSGARLFRAQAGFHNR